jgi:hypothetical protein
MYNCARSLTSVLDGSGWWTPCQFRFTAGKATGYGLYRRLGRPQGWSGRVRKFSFPTGFDPWTFQAVASRYIYWRNVTRLSLDLTVCGIEWQWRIRKDVEGKCSGVTGGTVLHFAYTKWIKQLKMRVKVPCLWRDINRNIKCKWWQAEDRMCQGINKVWGANSGDYVYRPTVLWECCH